MHKQSNFLTLLDEEHYAGPKYSTRDCTHDYEVWPNGCQSISNTWKDTKYTNLGVVRKALVILMSRNPLKYSQRPIEIQAMAAKNSKDASGMELASFCSLVLGTKRA